MRTWLLTLAPLLLGTVIGAAQDSEQVLRVGEGGVRPPTKVIDVRPRYPQATRDAGVGGGVLLDMTVDAGGMTRDIHVLRSPEGDYGFDVAAVEAVRQWEYEPTWLNGEPVSVTFTVTISFLPPRSEDQAPAEVERLRTRS